MPASWAPPWTEAQASSVLKSQIYLRIKPVFDFKAGLLFRGTGVLALLLPPFMSQIVEWGEELFLIHISSSLATVFVLTLCFDLSGFGFWSLKANIHVAWKFQTINLWVQKPIFKTWKTEFVFPCSGSDVASPLRVSGSRMCKLESLWGTRH